jgi:prepilin-type processing-associated H-X9-DG protein
MAFYHSPAQIETMTGIADQAGDNNEPFVPSYPQGGDCVANPDGKIIISEWFSNHYQINVEQKWFIWEGKRNYLFADGHVLYLETSELRPANDGLPNPNLTTGGIKGIDWPK